MKNLIVTVNGVAYNVTAAAPAPAAAPAASAAPAGAAGSVTVTAPMPGNILDVKVKAGDSVKAGDTLLILEAMKMENAVTTDYAGTVKQVLVQPGENVATDAVLAEIG